MAVLLLIATLMTSCVYTHAADVTFRTQEHILNNEVGNLKQTEYILSVFPEIVDHERLKFRSAPTDERQRRVAEVIDVTETTGDVTTSEGIDREEFCAGATECFLELNILALLEPTIEVSLAHTPSTFSSFPRMSGLSAPRSPQLMPLETGELSRSISDSPGTAASLKSRDLRDKRKNEVFVLTKSQDCVSEKELKISEKETWRRARRFVGMSWDQTTCLTGLSFAHEPVFALPFVGFCSDPLLTIVHCCNTDRMKRSLECYCDTARNA